MRTIRVKDVFDDVCRLRGWDPVTVSLGAGDRAALAGRVNERLRMGVEYAWWPELMWVEQRRYELDWAEGSTYGAGDVVWYEEAYWESLVDANLGNTPAVGAFWQSPPGASWVRVIKFRVSGQREIGDVDVGDCLFREDPRVSLKPGLVDGVRLHYDGILAPAWAPDEPWVKWRRPAPEVSWTEWGAGTAYSIGDLAYVTSTGMCYRANAATTGESPPDTPAVWAPVWVPAFLRRYVVHGAFADGVLEREERYKEEAIAAAELESLEDRLVDQPGLVRRVRFR
jgi:hypothetical protein